MVFVIRLIFLLMFLSAAADIFSQEYVTTLDTTVIRPGIILVRETTEYKDDTEIFFDTVVYRDTSYEPGYRTIQLITTTAHILINKRATDTVSVIDTTRYDYIWPELLKMKNKPVIFCDMVGRHINRDKKIPSYVRSWTLSLYSNGRSYKYRERVW